jgi:hypothetical protein
MRTLNPQFDHIVVAIEKPSDFSSLKSEDLQVSKKLMSRSLLTKNWVQDSIHALQAQIFKKGGANNRFKGKKDEGKNKKGN